MNTSETPRNGIEREELQGSRLREEILHGNGPSAIATESELDASRAAVFTDFSSDEPLWIFAYGSLVWNPIFQVNEHRRARLHGFHRSFCMTSTIGRGTMDRPGLMLALDRGGSVDGVALKMNPVARDEEIRMLWRREMLPKSYDATWVTVDTNEGPIKALAFVANPNVANYVGELPLSRAAAQIGEASGLLGSNLDYLHSTNRALRSHGIDDPYLRGLLSLCRA